MATPAPTESWSYQSAHLARDRPDVLVWECARCHLSEHLSERFGMLCPNASERAARTFAWQPARWIPATVVPGRRPVRLRCGSNVGYVDDKERTQKLSNH